MQENTSVLCGSFLWFNMFFQWLLYKERKAPKKNLQQPERQAVSQTTNINYSEKALKNTSGKTTHINKLNVCNLHTITYTHTHMKTRKLENQDPKVHMHKSINTT